LGGIVIQKITESKGARWNTVENTVANGCMPEPYLLNK